MKVSNDNIDCFLTRGSSTFVIPVYQRNYDWQINQCKQLIMDIQGIVDTNESHFIGTICVKPETRKTCMLIDGQQRITTILLIFKAIYDLSDDNLLKEKIKSRYLLESYSKGGTRLKLKPIKKDESVFEKLISNDVFDENLFDSIEKLSNIYSNYIYIKELINNDVKDGLYTISDFEDAVERLEIVELSLDNENPQVIFESLNSTGLDLTDSDLLRNYLLMSLNYEDQEHLYYNYWRKIEEYLHNDNRILEDFMVYFLITKKRSNATIHNGKKASITNNKLYSSFKRDYPRIDRSNLVEVENCFKEILQYAKYYSHFIFDDMTVRENLDEKNKLFYDLIYLMNSKDSVIVLMYLLNKYEKSEIDNQTLISCIKGLISLSVRACVCDKVGLSKQFSALMIQKLDKIQNSNNFIDDFWDALTMGNGSYGFPKDNEFKYMLETKSIYTTLGSRKTKYILYELERFINPKEIHIYSEGTIEHIMPQTLSDEWKKYLKNKNDLVNYESHLHLLGNLSLTGYNSELGNDIFDNKKKEYVKSNYSNTRSIAKYVDWSSSEIDSRGSELIDYALKIWELPLNYNTKSGLSLGVIYGLDTDFNLFTGTKPLEVTFLGGTTKISSWAELVVSVLTDCYEMDKQIFSMLLNYNGFYGNKVYINTSVINMNHPVEIAKSGIYVDTGNSVVANLGLIEKVLEFYDDKMKSDLVKDLSFTLSKV